MKRFALQLCMLSVLFLFGTGSVQAQDDHTTSIVSQMKEATKNFESEVKELRSKLESGELNKDSFEDSMEEAADKFEEKMEALGEALGDKYDDDDEAGVQIATDSSGNKVKITLGEKKDRKRTNSYFLFNFGPTYLIEGTIGVGDANKPDFSPWKSWSGNMGVIFSTRIGGNSSVFNINYGLEFKFTSIEINSDHRLKVEDGNPFYVPPSPYASTVSKSEFRRYSLVVPVQLRLAGSGENKLNVMLGGYGGLRLYGIQDLKFKSMDGEKAELHLKDDYQTNTFLYGVSAAIGQRWWQLYADYELSNLFEDNPNYEYNILNAGVQFFF